MDKQLQDLEDNLTALRPRGLSPLAKEDCHTLLDDLASGRHDVVPFPSPISEQLAKTEPQRKSWSRPAIAAACAALITLGAGGGYQLAQMTAPTAAPIADSTAEPTIEELAAALEVDVQSLRSEGSVAFENMTTENDQKKAVAVGKEKVEESK